MKYASHDLGWSDLRDFLNDLQDEYGITAGDIVDMLSYDGNSTELDKMVAGVERWVEDEGLNNYDGWEDEFTDEDGNILPEYEDDEFAQEVVNGEGQFDFIGQRTGIYED